MKDLIVLVADKDMSFTLQGLLSRPDAFGTRKFNFDIYIHPQRDPGVYLRSHQFLREFLNRYQCALVMFDREGCGQERSAVLEIETTVKKNLERNGWTNRCEVIVLNPELEIWAWIFSPQLATNIGWNDTEELKQFLINQKFLLPDQQKPNRPKEAFLKALRIKRIQKSSAIYKQIAESIDFNPCIDPAFSKLKNTLLRWFPVKESKNE